MADESNIIVGAGSLSLDGLDIGYTKDITVRFETEYVEVEVDQEVGVVKKGRLSERMFVSVIMLEPTFWRLHAALNQPGSISGGFGQKGNTLTLGQDDGCTVASFEITIIGVGPDCVVREFTLYECVSANTVEYNMSREEETAIEVEFECVRSDVSNTFGKVIDGEIAEEMYWTWSEVQSGSDAEDVYNIVPVIRNNVYGDIDIPATVADQVYTTADNRGLEEGQLAIIPQNFGNGDLATGTYNPDTPALWNHDDDVLADDQIPQYQRTIWFSNGVAECLSWMNFFIQQFKYRQSLPGNTVPDPSRFMFDMVGSVSMHRNFDNMLAVFHEMRTNDSRWNTENVYGFDSQTMADLWALAPTAVTSYDELQSGSAAVNQPLMNWYQGISHQAMDGALEVAAYAPIRNSWPGVRSCTFRWSAAYDGLGSPARERFWHQESSWYKYSCDTFGDMKGEALYDDRGMIGMYYETGGETLKEANLRKCAELIDYGANSFSVDGSDLMPWIVMPGFEQTMETYGSQTYTQAHMSDIVAMCSARGVREWMVWIDPSADTVANWDKLAAIVSAR